MVHIGEKIKETVQEKGIRVTDFAKNINCSRRNVYSIFGKHTIDTGLLLRISRTLQHNFFRYYMAEQETGPAYVNISAEKSITYVEESREELQSPVQNEMEKKIVQLENEVTYLTEINKLLREKMNN